MSRRGLAAVAAAAVAGSAGLAVGIWLGTSGTAQGDEPDRQQYLREVSSVCRRYARRLATIGAPSDVAAYGDLVSSLRRVVPLLEHQAAAMRAVKPPGELQERIERLFALDRRSVAALETILAAARRRDAGGVAAGLGRFSVARDRSHALALAIGIRCQPN